MSEFQPYIERANELLAATPPLPPPPAQRMWYLVRCIDCDTQCGTFMSIPCATADDCSLWALEHAEATGHTVSVWQEPRS